MQLPFNIGKYHIEKELGHGAMGVVFYGIDESLDRPIAVKVLAKDFFSDPQQVSRFTQEAKIVAKLDHPNIMKIYAIEKAMDATWIIMEYLRGNILADILKQGGALPIDRCMKLVEQLASALGYAHSRGIIHRDIKPTNVMITPEDSVKLMDFGIARDTESDLNLTRTGTIIGTPRYMSPEQFKGHGVDHCSDIYSLGIMAYEMVCGEAPFSGKNLMDYAYKHFNQTPDPIRKKVPSIPATFEQFIMKSISKKKEARPQNLSNISFSSFEADTLMVKSPFGGFNRPSLKKMIIFAGVTLFVIMIILFWIKKESSFKIKPSASINLPITAEKSELTIPPAPSDPLSVPVIIETTSNPLEPSPVSSPVKNLTGIPPQQNLQESLPVLPAEKEIQSVQEAEEKSISPSPSLQPPPLLPVEKQEEKEIQTMPAESMTTPIQTPVQAPSEVMGEETPPDQTIKPGEGMDSHSEPAVVPSEEEITETTMSVSEEPSVEATKPEEPEALPSSSNEVTRPPKTEEETKNLTPWTDSSQNLSEEKASTLIPSEIPLVPQEEPPVPPPEVQPVRTSDLLTALSAQNYTKIRALVTQKVKSGKCKGDFLLDVRVVLEQYMEKSSEDKIAVDAIRWCCIAIEKSGNKEFVPLLKKLEKAHVHRGIQSNASRAIRVIYEKSGQTVGSYEKNLLGRLKSGEWSVIRNAAKEMVKNNQFSPLLLGQVKTILEQYSKKPGEEKVTLDAVCWCLTVFGKSKNQHYLAFLKKLEKVNLPRKVKSSVTEAIADIEGRFHIPYLPTLGKTDKNSKK